MSVHRKADKSIVVKNDKTGQIENHVAAPATPPASIDGFKKPVRGEPAGSMMVHPHDGYLALNEYVQAEMLTVEGLPSSSLTPTEEAKLDLYLETPQGQYDAKIWLNNENIPEEAKKGLRGKIAAVTNTETDDDNPVKGEVDDTASVTESHIGPDAMILGGSVVHQSTVDGNIAVAKATVGTGVTEEKTDGDESYIGGSVVKVGWWDERDDLGPSGEVLSSNVVNSDIDVHNLRVSGSVVKDVQAEGKFFTCEASHAVSVNFSGDETLLWDSDVSHTSAHNMHFSHSHVAFSQVANGHVREAHLYDCQGNGFFVQGDGKDVRGDDFRIAMRSCVLGSEEGWKTGGSRPTIEIQRYYDDTDSSPKVPGSLDASESTFSENSRVVVRSDRDPKGVMNVEDVPFRIHHSVITGSASVMLGGERQTVIDNVTLSGSFTADSPRFIGGFLKLSRGYAGKDAFVVEKGHVQVGAANNRMYSKFWREDETWGYAQGSFIALTGSWDWKEIGEGAVPKDVVFQNA